MHPSKLETEQSGASVCPVGDSVGNLCPWCNEVLKPSRTKPRKYCTEAHEKAFKRAGCISKKESEEEAQWAIDYYLAHFNRNRAFSTFGRHEPMTEVPTYSLKKIKDKVLEHVGSYRPAIDLRGEKQMATTPRKVTHQVDVNNRPGNNADSRPASMTAANMETPADRLVGVIFGGGKRGRE